MSDKLQFVAKANMVHQERATNRKFLGLRLRLEVQHQPRADRHQNEAYIDQRIWRRLGRVLPHREQHVHDRSAAKHQRHYVSRNASTLESVDDAKGADGTKRSSQSCPGDASAVEVLQPSLLGSALGLVLDTQCVVEM